MADSKLGRSRQAVKKGWIKQTKAIGTNVFEFKILKASKKSRARLGVIKTSHGLIKTPAFVPVATLANVKTLDSGDLLKSGTQALIANTFHLHLKPTEEIVEKAGGLHLFMNWRLPLMTDSAGFQVFSLKQKKIRADGVYFRSPLDGREIFIGPKESIAIQEKLGADIVFSFDECTSPRKDKTYVARALERTHRWAKICLEAKKTNQALYGVVQGGRYKDLRQTSASFLSGLGFEGFGIGSEFGEDKREMAKMISWVVGILPKPKPRHLLGVGHLEDLRVIIKEGIDTFDCVAPTRYGRHGVALTSKGNLNITKSIFLKDKAPLDEKCDCYVCREYSRSYLSHLIRAKEITGMRLLSYHNLYFFNQEVAKIRQEIKESKF